MLSILKRLTKGSLIYGLGDLFQRIIGFLLIPVYTRFLTTSDYGIVGVTNAVASIFGIFLGMGLRGSITRHYYDYADNPEDVREYLSTVFLFFLLASFLVVGILTIFGKPLFDSIFSEIPFHPYIRLALWTSAFSASSSILLGLYRAREQTVRYVTIRVAQFLLSLGLIVYFVVALHQGALGKIKGGFYAGLMFFILFLVLTMRESKFSVSVSKLANALSFGLPLVPHLLAGWVLQSADRFLLERLTSLSEVGLYSFAYQLGMGMSMVVLAINYAWAPIFYDIADSKEDAKQTFGRIFTIYMILISFLGLLGVLFAREVVLVMAATSYHAAIIAVPPVIAGYIFQGMYFMTVASIFYRKKTTVIPFFTGLAALVNIGLNIIWIPKYGMMGAAYATLIAFAVLFVLVHVYAQFLYKIPYAYGKAAIILTMFGTTYIINSYLRLDGLLIPILVKLLILIGFVFSLLAFRVFTFKEVKRVREIFK